MRENEAKTKWCPFTRVALVSGMSANVTANMDHTGNGYANIYEETRCRGSECMLWQWTHRGLNEHDGTGQGICGAVK